MEQIKVMIVDDEILAIEDIIDLIDWDSIGCKIVATAKNGMQAVERFKADRPDVIISDIMMPVMNGLEMSKNIISLDKNVKILLLTGYEEFAYAKMAVKIGVYDYVLKNELNSESLYSRMQELKGVIKKEKYESDMILRNILKDSIDGKYPSAEQLSDRIIVRQHESLFFLLFELDQPFLSVLSGFSEDEPYDTLEVSRFSLDSDNMPEGFSKFEIVPLEKHRIVLLLKMDRNLSEYDIRNKLYALARYVQRNFKNETGKTLTSYLCLRKIVVKSYREMYERIKEISRYKVFFGREQLFDIYNTAIQCSIADIEFSEKMLADSINDFNINSMELYIEQLFSQAAGQAYNLEGLIFFTKELLHVLQGFKRSINRAGTGLSKPRGEIDEKFWYKAEDIKQWFKLQFSNVVKELETVNKHRFSAEVQRAVEYIQEFYYKEDLTIGEVAEQIGFSVTYLSAKLKKETGVTFLEYLTGYRIEKAKKLLASENIKIYEISGKIGYKTSQYFSHVFYKATGKTPIDYRKELI